MRRVVITGIGAVTPVGNDIETMWDSLVNGKNGIDYIKSFDTEKLKVKVAAEVKDFDPTKYIEKKELRKTDLFCQYAIAAACQTGYLSTSAKPFVTVPFSPHLALSDLGAA